MNPIIIIVIILSLILIIGGPLLASRVSRHAEKSEKENNSKDK